MTDAHATFVNNGKAPYARTFGPGNKHWMNHEWSNHEWSNRMFIQTQQNWFNDLLKARGYVFLNDVYEALGFERTRSGQIVGWSKDSGKTIEFDYVDDSTDGGIILNFNVDGIILHKLPR